MFVLILSKLAQGNIPYYFCSAFNKYIQVEIKMPDRECEKKNKLLAEKTAGAVVKNIYVSMFMIAIFLGN